MKIKQDVRSVYIIFNKETNKTKIGVSNNPEKRLLALQSACGSKLRLIYSSKQIYNYFKIESDMHTLYSDVRSYGEWFKCNPKQPAIRLKEMINDKDECRIIKKYVNKVPVSTIAYQMKVSRQGVINYLKSKGYLKPKKINNIPMKKERSDFIKTKLSLQEMVDANNQKLKLRK